jgi:hypothetical protein
VTVSAPDHLPSVKHRGFFVAPTTGRDMINRTVLWLCRSACGIDMPDRSDVLGVVMVMWGHASLRTILHSRNAKLAETLEQVKLPTRTR